MAIDPLESADFTRTNKAYHKYQEYINQTESENKNAEIRDSRIGLIKGRKAKTLSSSEVVDKNIFKQHMPPL